MHYQQTFCLIQPRSTSAFLALLRFSRSCNWSVLASYMKKADSELVEVLDESIINLCTHPCLRMRSSARMGLPSYRRLPQTTADYRRPMSMFTADQRK